jgi:mycothiol synthase
VEPGSVAADRDRARPVTTGPSELRFRAPAPDDAAAVTAVINERELADRGSTEITAEMVRAHWSEREIELAVDGRLAVVGGRAVGYALATRDREFVSVAPAYEGRGIGSTLLHWTIARSRERGAALHRQLIGGDNAAAAALLRSAGYDRMRSQHRMQMTLAGPLPAARPTQTTIRRIDPGRDARELHRVDAEAFADNADSAPETFEQFCDEHLETPARDPDATIAAIDDGRIVGFLLAERRDEGRVGYVSVLGVSAGWRGRGVGTALVSAAVEVWLAAGVGRAGLTVASDNPGARRLYERLGMTVRSSLEEYERAVSAPSTPRSSVRAAD